MFAEDHGRSVAVYQVGLIRHRTAPAVAFLDAARADVSVEA